jgi:hypothetical protein
VSAETRLIQIQDVKDEEIDEQIKVREELMTQLIGQLYSGIVFDEIIALRRRYYNGYRST